MTSALRRFGYRILPADAFSYVLHLRPREWPIMAAHTALGWILAEGVLGVVRGRGLRALALGLVIWVIFGNGGTLAINSAFDKDDGDIGYLDDPPPPPAHLAGFAFALMIAGQGLSLLLGPRFALAYAACFAMSLAYSVPPLRLKAVAGADWVINMVGFGTLTPYAGWAITGRPLPGGMAVVLWSFAALFGSLYPLTQLYQFDEDARRGDRTLALMLGMRGSLLVALGAAAVAFGMLAWAAWRAECAPWQWGALAVAAGSWAAVLLPWLARHRTMSAREHQRGMYAALTAWAVTDLAVVAAFAA
ncbi:MAG TPA: UbiA family prenyltransferase [Gemmatimonadaceae bacterium]|nr:UbiA family prenyltransferase [Gemmatimonadaceae bacterium]